MKKSVYLVLTALLCASCFHVNTNFKGIGGMNTVKGEGPVISKSFDLKDFDAIVINGHADAVFTQSSTYEVTLSTQENIFDHMDIRVEGSTLVIETKDKVNIRAEKYDFVLQAPVLKSLTVNGASDFNIPSGLRTEGDLKIEVNGAGDLTFNQIECNTLSVQANGASDIDADSLKVNSMSILVNGAGDVRLSGTTESASFEVNGAGDIDARNLRVAGEVKRHTAGMAKIRF
jgi:hypothetical protein